MPTQNPSPITRARDVTQVTQGYYAYTESITDYKSQICDSGDSQGYYACTESITNYKRHRCYSGHSQGYYIATTADYNRQCDSDYSQMYYTMYITDYRVKRELRGEFAAYDRYSDKVMANAVYRKPGDGQMRNSVECKMMMTER
jgi:hypothetical protein